MSEPVLYHRYRREEAITLFGPADQACSLCDGQWLVLPGHILCLAVVGTPPGPSHFASASRFCWAADKPYRAEGDRWDLFLPQEVRAGRQVERPIFLFVRRPDQTAFTSVGRLREAYSWGSGESGLNFGEAYFDLSPPLPSRIGADLGALRTESPDHQGLDLSLARLAQPLPVHERLAILRQVVEYWHGSLQSEDGLPEPELAGLRLPLPLRWWYALAGRRRGLVDGFNALYGPTELEPIEDGRVLFLSENQGCYHWATLPEGEDPPVWGSSDAAGPWIEEGMTLSEFLIQSCLFESINGAASYHATAGVGEEGLARLSQVSPPLPLAPWHWPAPRTTFHVGGGAFLMAVPLGETEENRPFELTAAARTEHPLGRLACALYQGWARIDWRPPPIDPSWLRWNDATVLKLAGAIRSERRFTDLPVLADALEEAGCSDAELLHHCRRPPPHTSGCYILDALLGLKQDWGSRTWSPDEGAHRNPFARSEQP